MSNLKTKLHSYWFDVSKPDEKEAYALMCILLAHQNGLKCFESLSMGDMNHHQTGLKAGPDVELEVKHLFNNQWNGVKYRLFDWAQDVLHNPSIKQGYWLEQTAEMREIRRNRNHCRYCGKQEEAQRGTVFCPHCIDSEYLKASDLYLTRMMPVTDGLKSPPPLTEAEKAHLLPLYKEAQLHGSTARGKARIESEREKLEAKYKKAIHAAKTEHDGFLWLMDHGINTSNVIYYSHTDTFCFGWRRPLEPEVLSEWLNIASEFPFTYEIKQKISY